MCVTDWWWNPGHERDQDFYLDICEIVRDGDRWRLTDHYLDIVVRNRRGAEVIDVDEFVAAVAAGLLDPADRRGAPCTARTARCDGIAAHGHDLDAWLGGLGIALSWQPRAGRSRPRPSARAAARLRGVVAASSGRRSSVVVVVVVGGSSLVVGGRRRRRRRLRRDVAASVVGGGVSWSAAVGDRGRRGAGGAHRRCLGGSGAGAHHRGRRAPRRGRGGSRRSWSWSAVRR